jgi:DNA-directed RNA polymerase subunit M
VSPWTCPNSKCAYDKQLQPKQHCPLCGKEAKEFSFNELDDLWKQKWDFKKSTEREKKKEKLSARMKFCPKCGSENINALVFYRPSGWRCLDCGYEGLLIIEDSKFAEKIRERYQKDAKDKGKPQ